MSTELLDQLAVISRSIEQHRAAIWLLERQRADIQILLTQSGWKPSEPQPSEK